MSSPTYILTIDQGTTSSRCLIFEAETMALVSQGSSSFRQIFPKPSWVEHNLQELWGSVRSACKEALDLASLTPGFRLTRIGAIGITNQRETLCFLDQNTKPLMGAIVWQCKRSAELCQKLRSHFKSKDRDIDQILRQRTGLPLDPYFSGSKLLWVLKSHPQIKKLWQNGQMLVGTIDSFLIARLSGGNTWVSEPSNACRTLLCSLKGNWDPELFDLLSIPLPPKSENGGYKNLATLQNSHGVFAQTSGLDFLPDGIPITGVLGDQQAATLAQQCLEPFSAKCTYGTGAFLLAYTGTKATTSRHGLLSTIGWKLTNECHYLLEGSSFMAGAAMDYLKDQWHFFSEPQNINHQIKNLTASPHIYFVPAFAGLGAPHWKPEAKATLVGLSRDTTSHQITRAMVEGVVFSVTDLIKAMEADLGGGLKSFKVDGGFSQNDVAMQLQANLTHLSVVRPSQIEATALGAAIMAAYGTSLRPSLTLEPSSPPTIFRPQFTATQRNQHIEGWKRALKATTTFS